MPLYEYVCPNNHIAEVLSLSFDSRPVHWECQVCGLESKFKPSAPSFVIEGQRAPIDTTKEAWEGLPPQMEEGAAKFRRDRLGLGRKINSI